MPKDTLKLASFVQVLQSFPMMFPVPMVLPMECPEKNNAFLLLRFDGFILVIDQASYLNAKHRI